MGDVAVGDIRPSCIWRPDCEHQSGAFCNDLPREGAARRVRSHGRLAGSARAGLAFARSTFERDARWGTTRRHAHAESDWTSPRLALATRVTRLSREAFGERRRASFCPRRPRKRRPRKLPVMGIATHRAETRSREMRIWTVSFTRDWKRFRRSRIRRDEDDERNGDET
jgi:hypothetical protein